MRKVGLLLRITFCLSFAFFPLEHSDRWVYDHLLRYNHNRRPSASISLVKINQGSWQPSTSSTLLRENIGNPIAGSIYRKLAFQLQRQEPAVVVFSSLPISVDEIAQLMDLSRTVLPGRLDENNRFILPSPEHGSGLSFGYNNVFPDSDNQVRRTFLVFASAPSLGLEAFRKFNGRNPTRDLLSPFWLHFAAPNFRFPQYSAEALLTNSIPAGTLKGKIILVGEETPSEIYHTPFGLLSRLEIIATSLDNLLENTDIRHATESVRILVSILFTLLTVALVLFLPPARLGWSLLPALLLSVAISCSLFLSLDTWIGLSNTILGIIGSYLFLSGYRLASAAQKQWKLQKEAEYLKDMDQFKNNFISLFSHDLKTPIARMAAVIQRLMGRQATDSEMKKDLETIRDSNLELERSISDILRVTKMETIPVEPRREVLDFNPLVEKAVERLRYLSDSKQTQIVLDLEPLFSIEGDSQLILEVMLNLIDNAIKYGPDKGIITIRTWEEKEKMWFSVSDQGAGLAPSEIPRVTGKFYRAPSTAKTIKGSGLGLYLAKYFVEVHGGKLEIKSELGKGTTVSFYLPFASANSLLKNPL